MVSKILKKIIKVFIFPINLTYIISYIFPRKPNSICIGAWGGMYYRGNCKYFYKYLKNFEDFEVYWITKSKSIYKKNLHDKNLLYSYSFIAIYKTLTSKILIYSHSLNDFIPQLTGGTIKILMHHTTYPMKDMSYIKYTKKLSLLEKSILILLSPYNFIKPNYEIVSSLNNNGIYLDPTKKNEKSKILALGLPKTDYLIDLKKNAKNYDKLNLLKNYFSSANTKSKLILFLPTWRADKNFSIFNFEFNSEKLSKFLINTNSYMLIISHPFDIAKNFQIKKISRQKFISSDSISIENLLKNTDIFITDYSSLFSDFLLFEKEIIFAKFDHVKYLKERELILDYDKLPGYKVKNWNELINCLYLSTKKTEIYNELRLSYIKKIYGNNLFGGNNYKIYSFLKTII